MGVITGLIFTEAEIFCPETLVSEIIFSEPDCSVVFSGTETVCSEISVKIVCSVTGFSRGAILVIIGSMLIESEIQGSEMVIPLFLMLVLLFFLTGRSSATTFCFFFLFLRNSISGAGLLAYSSRSGGKGIPSFLHSSMKNRRLSIDSSAVQRGKSSTLTLLFFRVSCDIS